MLNFSRLRMKFPTLIEFANGVQTTYSLVRWKSPRACKKEKLLRR